MWLTMTTWWFTRYLFERGKLKPEIVILSQPVFILSEQIWSQTRFNFIQFPHKVPISKCFNLRPGSKIRRPLFTNGSIKKGASARRARSWKKHPSWKPTRLPSGNPKLENWFIDFMEKILATITGWPFSSFHFPNLSFKSWPNQFSTSWRFKLAHSEKRLARRKVRAPPPSAKMGTCFLDGNRFEGIEPWIEIGYFRTIKDHI